MLAITVDGYSLAAIVVVGVLALLLARLIARLMRDHGIRITRVGLFIEREHFEKARHEQEERVEEWTPDPLAREPSDIVREPYPLPPPTPPPPLPPRPPDHPDEATEAWPKREESP